MKFSNMSLHVKYEIFLFFLERMNENNDGIEYLLYSLNFLSDEKIYKKDVENVLGEYRRIYNGDLNDSDDDLCDIVNKYKSGRHIGNIEEAKVFYFENGCNDMAICRDTGTLGIEFRNLHIDEEIIRQWNNEYILSKPVSEIGDSLLERFVHKSISDVAIIKLYDIFIERLNSRRWNKRRKRDFLLTQAVTLLGNPFSGLIYKVTLIGDKEKQSELIRIYIDSLRQEVDLKGCMSLALFSLYYNLDLDKYVIEVSDKKTEEWFDDACKHGDELWPICCFLMGIKKEKSILNAYRAVRFGYDKYGTLDEDLLTFLNKVTKNDYTIDYVLSLEPLVKEFKETEFDNFIKEELKKINSYT